MFVIEIAGIRIGIEHRYAFVRHLCKDYIVAPTEEPPLTVSVTEEEIRLELMQSPEKDHPEYAEGVCIYRTICRQLPLLFDAYLMHCALIEYEGQGYAFAAKSGVGKSTHIRLWQERFGEAVHIVNGDKPIFRFCKGQLLAYGTPWCGKEGFNRNESVPLKAICFLERASENSIVSLSPREAVTRIFHQILTPQDLQTADALIPLLDRTLKEIPCYLLRCNMQSEAAEVAYRGMNAANADKHEKEREE